MQRLGWRGLPAAAPAPATPPAPPMAALEGVEATRAGAVNALRDALGAAGGDLLAAFSARSGNFLGLEALHVPAPATRAAASLAAAAVLAPPPIEIRVAPQIASAHRRPVRRRRALEGDAADASGEGVEVARFVPPPRG